MKICCERCVEWFDTDAHEGLCPNCGAWNSLPENQSFDSSEVARSKSKPMDPLMTQAAYRNGTAHSSARDRATDNPLPNRRAKKQGCLGLQ